MSVYSNPWTAAREQKLRELWPDEELSCADIARELGGGLSRSAILGKGFRLKLGPKPTNYACATGTTKILNRERKAKPKRNFGGVWSNYPNAKAEPFVARSVALPSLNLSIMEVRADQCKYIAGDDHLCCGHPVKDGHSWCPSHCAIVYQPRTERSAKQKAHDAKLGQRTARRDSEKTAWMAEEAA